MYPSAENIYMTGSLYHNYRGNHIIDNGLKSGIFVEVNDLWITRRSKYIPYTANTLSTSSPKWLVTFTAILPVCGLANGRLAVL
jgi:hypothetical protein